MSIENIVESVILLLLFITGFMTKRITKEKVKELDGFSLIYRSGDCPGTIVGGIDESDRLESRKQHKEPFWSWVVILMVSGVAGIGIYTQVVAQEAMSADLNLQGKVEIQGDMWEGTLSDFSFRMTDESSSAVETVIRPDKEGNLYFGSYSYYKEGTYSFKIRQEEGTTEGMTYDTKDISVTVIIKEKNGSLESEVKIRKGGTAVSRISFTNTYKAPEMIQEETEKHIEQKPDKPVRETEAGGDGNLVISKTGAKEVEAEPSVEEPEIRQYRYMIRLENTGDAPVYGVYVRDYMPEYTVYCSHEGEGQYGAIEGKEHVTLFLDELEAGETVDLQITIRLRSCLPDNSMAESQTLYEVQGNSDMIYTNDPDDPVYLYHAEELGT